MFSFFKMKYFLKWLLFLIDSLHISQCGFQDESVTPSCSNKECECPCHEQAEYDYCANQLLHNTYVQNYSLCSTMSKRVKWRNYLLFLKDWSTSVLFVVILFLICGDVCSGFQNVTCKLPWLCAMDFSGVCSFCWNFTERWILWSLWSVDFHTFTLQLPIQTLHSVAPELPSFCEFTWKLLTFQQNERTPDLTLECHLPTSWWRVWQLSYFVPHIGEQALVGLETRIYYATASHSNLRSSVPNFCE